MSNTFFNVAKIGNIFYKEEPLIFFFLKYVFNHKNYKYD